MGRAGGLVHLRRLFLRRRRRRAGWCSSIPSAVPSGLEELAASRQNNDRADFSVAPERCSRAGRAPRVADLRAAAGPARPGPGAGRGVQGRRPAARRRRGLRGSGGERPHALGREPPGARHGRPAPGRRRRPRASGPLAPRGDDARAGPRDLPSAAGACRSSSCCRRTASRPTEPRSSARLPRQRDLLEAEPGGQRLELPVRCPAR